MIRSFLTMPRARQRGLLAAVAITGVTRLGLWFLPYRHVRGFVDRTGRRPVGYPTDRTPTRIAWEVAQASRVIPRATCLVQALAAEWLIRRTGAPVELMIGVANNDTKGFHAHAWLESGGRVILGAEGRDGFVPLEPSVR